MLKQFTEKNLRRQAKASQSHLKATPKPVGSQPIGTLNRNDAEELIISGSGNRIYALKEPTAWQLGKAVSLLRISRHQSRCSWP